LRVTKIWLCQDHLCPVQSVHPPFRPVIAASHIPLFSPSLLFHDVYSPDLVVTAYVANLLRDHVFDVARDLPHCVDGYARLLLL